MTDALATFKTRGPTPQTQPIFGRDMVKNAAGGYVFKIDPVAQVRRFLILGTDGGTFYASPAELTKTAGQAVIALAERDHEALRKVILEVSLGGLAPKQNATLFALAIAASVGSPYDRGVALAMLPDVARTGTHLFLFARYVEQFRGWGPQLVRGVAEWYRSKGADDLAFQVLKYQQREGWSHRDLIRLSHPARARKRGLAVDDTITPAHRAVLDWVHNKRAEWEGDLPRVLAGYELAKRATPEEVPALIREYRLPWEAVPDAARKLVATWEALLDNGMSAEGLVRQLPTMTRHGVIGPMRAGRTSQVIDLLTDSAFLRKGRMHPIKMLVAQRTYAQGYSENGKATWTPVTEVIDALDRGFYAAYGAVEPAGKRTMFAVDVSQSMTHPISGLPLSAREAAAALALVGAATEPEHIIAGFTDGSSGGYYGRGGALPCYRMGYQGQQAFAQLPISPKQRLDDVLKYVDGLNFGATDCALPITEALRVGLNVDTFVVLTDNESWSGPIHVTEALARYRREVNPAAKLVAVAMTATEYSVADPTDTGMLDVVGFDQSVPGLIAEFARG